MTRWIVCQLGAREHYAIPRALHQAGQLHRLITDAWVTPRSVVGRLPGLQSLGDRYHLDLATASIKSFTPSLIQFEATHRLRKTVSWDRMMARNQWFQQQALTYLSSLETDGSQPPILFTYSYAALELLSYAKKRGWQTVLGQIDPGIYEEKIVVAEQAKYPDLAPHWQPVPPDYWPRWQQECELADHIAVNSTWSKCLLEQAGVDPCKIQVVPLAYTPPTTAQSFERAYPIAFSSQRPLKVLFLGLVTLRKGIANLLEAITQLACEPIEFWMVGPQEIRLPENFKNHPQIRWIGPVPRSQVETYYRQADVFLFPTLSDGFGLTQLEAQAWHLPIIASKNCGEVVQDGVDGIVLSEATATEIASSLRAICHAPQQLSTYAQNLNTHNSSAASAFSLSRLQVALSSTASDRTTITSP